jgi:hypothetical protein
MTSFPIAPAASRYLWFIVPLSLVLLGVIVIVALSLRGAHASRFDVLPDGLRLSGDLYGRTIPGAVLRLDEARRVDLSRETDLLPSWRRTGTALPGYTSGWFRLRNGEKALLYLTDRTRAVYVPTTAGYGLLLSPSDPDGFLASLRRIRPRS